MRPLPFARRASHGVVSAWDMHCRRWRGAAFRVVTEAEFDKQSDRLRPRGNTVLFSAPIVSALQERVGYTHLEDTVMLATRIL